MRFKKLRDNEVKELHKILKAQGLNREERRAWVKTIKRQVRGR